MDERNDVGIPYTNKETPGDKQDKKKLTEQEKKIRKQKIEKVITHVVYLTIIIILILLLLLKCDGRPVVAQPEKTPAAATATPGLLDANGELETTDPELEARLKAQMDDSMLAVSINSTPYLANGKADCNLQIENMSINTKPIMVEVYLDSDVEKKGEDAVPVYKTKGLLPPGSHIKDDKLDVELPTGQHKATAYFIGYDPEDMSKETGRAAVAIVITVDNYTAT